MKPFVFFICHKCYFLFLSNRSIYFCSKMYHRCTVYTFNKYWLNEDGFLVYFELIFWDGVLYTVWYLWTMSYETVCYIQSDICERCLMRLCVIYSLIFVNDVLWDCVLYTVWYLWTMSSETVCYIQFDIRECCLWIPSRRVLPHKCRK